MAPAPQRRPALASGQGPQAPCHRNRTAGRATIKQERPRPLYCASWGGRDGGAASFLFSGLSSDGSPVHPPVHPSVCLYRQSPANPPTPRPSAWSSVHSSVSPSSIYPSIHISIYHPAITPSTHVSIHPYLSVHLAMCLSNTYFVLCPIVGLC